MLKPLWAVLMMDDVIWGCQWSSLISFCPWWIKRSCGGSSWSSSPLAASESLSTDKSQRAIWLSAPPDANTLGSEGCHSTVVTGSVWCLNVATEEPACYRTKKKKKSERCVEFSTKEIEKKKKKGVHTLNWRRSQMWRKPSSPPETIKGSFLFQLITLTSDRWAPSMVSWLALLGAALVSQIRMLQH